MKNQKKFVTIVSNQILIYNVKDKSLEIQTDKENKKFSFEDMQAYKKSVKGTNRIYLPFAYLFWIDCKNGKTSNWNLI